jgi:hypothetical protein
MENTKVVIGALLFILLVVGANFVMYGIVRGWTRSNNKGFLETISKSLNTPVKKEDPMEELHQKLEELKKGEKQ